MTCMVYTIWRSRLCNSCSACISKPKTFLLLYLCLDYCTYATELRRDPHILSTYLDIEWFCDVVLFSALVETALVAMQLGHEHDQVYLEVLLLSCSIQLPLLTGSWSLPLLFCGLILVWTGHAVPVLLLFFVALVYLAACTGYCSMPCVQLSCTIIVRRFSFFIQYSVTMLVGASLWQTTTTFTFKVQSTQLHMQGLCLFFFVCSLPHLTCCTWMVRACWPCALLTRSQLALMAVSIGLSLPC